MNERTSWTRWSVIATTLCIGVLCVLVLRRQAKDALHSDSRIPRPDKTERPITSPSYVAAKSVPHESSTSSVSSPKADLSDRRKIFALLLSRHRQANHRGEWLTLFHRESFFHLREGRLLAAAFPEDVWALASPIAEDPQADRKDRAYSFYLLGLLAKQGNVQADAVLFRLASVPDTETADEALRNLFPSDRDGRHIPLYWARCKDWCFEAFEAVSRHGNTSSDPLLREISASTPGGVYPESSIHLLAEETLQRISLLSSPNWEEKLTKVLLDTKGDSATWAEWALAVATQKSMPNLLEVLRKRLDTGHLERERRIRKGLEDNFVTAPSSASLTGDGYFDEVLVVYWSLGGALKDSESRRLHTFGYACNPKERLAELLAEQ